MFIRISTTTLGLAVIVAASVSVFTLEKVNWGDALLGIFAGILLIYVKNHAAVAIIKTFFDKYEANKPKH